MEWQLIKTAPKDGSLVDLWIVGGDDTVDFYAPNAKKIKNKPLRHGRATNFRWMQKGSNRPNWYPAGGLGYPLSGNVAVTHWMPLPPEPSHD